MNPLKVRRRIAVNQQTLHTKTISPIAAENENINIKLQVNHTERKFTMKKSILAGILALTLLLSFTACSNSNEQKNPDVQLEKTDFNIGYMNSTAHLLAFVAKEEGYFKDEGLNVTLTQFSSAAELSSGLESGKLDVAFIGSVPTLTFQSQGHDLTIFGGAMTNGHGYVISPNSRRASQIGISAF